jgi:hypothetical protein
MMGEYEDRVAELREQNRAAAVDQAAARAAERDDNGPHCCGAPVEFSPVDSTERTWRYRCGQCGLLQDPR